MLRRAKCMRLALQIGQTVSRLLKLVHLVGQPFASELNKLSVAKERRFSRRRL